MATEFVLTPQPITTTTTGKQPLSQAMEVVDFDTFAALLSALQFTGVTYTVRIITGMQKDTESGWIEAATFSSQTVAGSWGVNSIVLLKYIRWEVVAFNGTTLTFFINGVLRTN